MDEKEKNRSIMEQALELMIEEARGEGFEEAKKLYKPDFKKILKKGRKQGFIFCIILLAASVYLYIKYKHKKPDTKDNVQYVNDDLDDIVTDIDIEEL